MRVFTPWLSCSFLYYWEYTSRKKYLVKKNFRDGRKVSNFVEKCPKYPIPYLNTLNQTQPYLNTLSRTIPYLNTLNRTLPYLNTLNLILIHGTQSISSRQPIRIEYYVTRELSAQVEIPSRLSARLGSQLPISMQRYLHSFNLTVLTWKPLSRKSSLVLSRCKFQVQLVLFRAFVFHRFVS